MKKTITIALAALITAAAIIGISVAQSETPPRDGVFVHISHGQENPHRLLMALNMAIMMADDHDVLVYFDIEGVKAVLSESDDVSLEPFPSLKSALETLRSKEVTLMACPGCLKAAGKSGEDLAEGIQIADKKTFFDFTTGRILTLDY